MTTERPSRRIVIVAGCYADAAPAINLAAGLARELRGLLLGVLAREPAVAAAAGAPVLRAPARRLQRLSAEELARAYAADARAFAARLADAARIAQLDWEFRDDVGRAVELATRLRRRADLVLVGHRRLSRMHGPVAALARPEDAATAALARGLAAAAGLRGPPRLVADGEQAMLDEIDRMAALALVVAPELALVPARLAALLEAARCPVLIAPDEAVLPA